MMNCFKISILNCFILNEESVNIILSDLSEEILFK